MLPCFRPNISHLREALECLLSQTFTNWNLHILNQPWDVNVHEGIADLIADSRITFVQSKILRNIGENWNAVVQYATGDYVQFMFHDDLWSPEYLSRCVAALDSHPDVGCSSACHEYQFEGQAAGREYFDWVKAESDRTPAGRQPGKEFLLKWLRRGLTPNLIGEPPFVMMRRTVMQRAGAFSETLPQALNYEDCGRVLG